jgi:hypothetical protein
MTRSIPAPSWGDAWHVLTMFWYTKNALLHLNPDITLTYNSYIFYPDGTPVVWEFPFANAASVPLQLLFGLPASYNILWLLSFVLAGYGAYLLVDYLTGNGYAALFAGIVFAFSPYHFAHGLGHIGLMTIEWIPFCALYLIKLHREYSIKNSILAGIFFILVAASDLHFLIYLSVFFVLLIGYDIFLALKKKRDNTFNGQVNFYNIVGMGKDVVKKYLIFTLTSLIGIIPLCYYMVTIAMSDNNFLQMPLSDTIEYSADLLGFLIPSPLHPVYGSWLLNNVYRYFTGNIAEYTVFIGYIVMILVIYAVLRRRNNDDIMFWLISGAFFFIMSLGPVLHIIGKTTFTGYGITIPLPYSILSYAIPIFHLDRTPARYDVMVMLCAAVLSGYGIALMMKKLNDNWLRVVCPIVFIVILLFEFASTPTISQVSAPSFYGNLSLDNTKYALLEVPETYNYGAGVILQYYQIYHNKPILGGQMARQPGDVWDFEKETPIVNELTFLKPMPDILQQNKSAIGNSIFNYYNIRYIILHTNYLNSTQVKFCESVINSTLDCEKNRYPKDCMIVYRVKNTSNPKTFMTIGDGWDPLEQWNDVPVRRMTNISYIKVISPSESDYTFSFEAGSANQDRDLYIYINDELAGKYVITSEISNDVTPFSISLNTKLKNGTNIVKFYSPNPGIKPSGMNSKSDNRSLGIAFQNFTITENMPGPE